MVKVWGAPRHPFSEGVTMIVFTKGPGRVLETVNGAISPVPLAASPIFCDTHDLKFRSIFDPRELTPPLYGSVLSSPNDIDPDVTNEMVYWAPAVTATPTTGKSTQVPDVETANGAL